jgi:peroxiredoxin
MTVIHPGIKAPPFSLRTIGGGNQSLAAALKISPLVVVSFFKVSCPVCQLAFPFLDRLHQNYPTVPVLGVSQDNHEDTEEFARSLDLTFPLLLDEDLQATVDYDLTNVPSTFLIGADGIAEQAIIGFAKADYEELNRRLAAGTARSVKPLFTETDDVPALRPG